MNQFDLEAFGQEKQDCFFAKLLRECSMDQQQELFIQQSNQQKFPGLEQPRKQREDQKIPVEEFARWKGLEDSDQQLTYQPQPQLTKAKSLRLEQQRKISTFIQVFGKNAIDPITGKIKTFSPQKHKRIMKTRNQK